MGAPSPFDHLTDHHLQKSQVPWDISEAKISSNSSRIKLSLQHLRTAWRPNPPNRTPVSDPQPLSHQPPLSTLFSLANCWQSSSLLLRHLSSRTSKTNSPKTYNNSPPRSNSCGRHRQSSGNVSIVQEMAWKRGRKVRVRWELRSVGESGIAIAREWVGGVKMGEQYWGRRRELESLCRRPSHGNEDRHC